MGDTPILEKFKVDRTPLENAKSALKDLGIMQDHAEANTIITHGEYKLDINGICESLELEVPGGHGFMFDIWKEDGGLVSFTRVFFSQGSVVEKHQHSVIELIALYKGKAQCTIYDEDNQVVSEPIVMAQFDTVRLDPNTKHSFKFIEDSWMAVLTMPVYNPIDDINSI